MNTNNITDIQLRYNINQAGMICGQNVIYTRKNADGTYDKVERIWNVNTHGGTPLYALTGTIVERHPGSIVVLPNNELLNMTPTPYGLKAYIAHFERGGASLANNNPWCVGSFTGRVLGVRRIPAPPKPMDEQVKELTTQIQQLTQKITTLTQQNAALSQTNQQKDAELRNVSQELARFNNLLEQLTKK